MSKIAKTFKDWIVNRFDHNKMADMANYGASGGACSGLAFYSDTKALYRRYKEDIWEMVREDADSFGESPLEMISKFGGASSVEHHCQIENLLVWYAAERVARDMTQGEYLPNENR